MEKKDNNKAISEPLAHYLNSSIQSEDVNLWPTVNAKLRLKAKYSANPRKSINNRVYSLVAIAVIFVVIISINPVIRHPMLYGLNTKHGSDIPSGDVKGAPTIKYSNLELIPSSVKIGQKIELKGSGFPDGDLRIDLLRSGDSVGSAFQTTIGNTNIINGSFSYSFVLSDKVNGNVIEPGLYKVQAVIFPPYKQMEGVFVNLTVQ